MARKAVSAARIILPYTPLALGMALAALYRIAPGDWLALAAILLLMLGILPVLLCWEERPVPLILGSLLLFASGIVQFGLIYTTSAPLPREALCEAEGTFASTRVIPRRGLDDYRVFLRDDPAFYRGLTFLGFPGKAISDTAQTGDAVEILYSEGRGSRSIYAFRLNGKDFLTYEATCRARRENQWMGIFFLFLPSAASLLRLWIGFRALRRARRSRPYRYTGRRR